MTATAVEQDTAPPIGSVALPARHLGCLGCGIAVAAPSAHHVRFGLATVVQVTAWHQEGVPLALTRPVTTELTRCPDCAGRAERATALVLAHPELSGRLGSVAGHRVELVLSGLAAIGVTPTPDVLDTAHRSLLRHLSVPSGAVRWSARCAPVLLSAAGPGRCSPLPWATAPPAAVDAVRHGWGQVLAGRVALTRPPVRVPCPDGGGCLMCGVRAVLVPAVRLVEPSTGQWRPLSVQGRRSGHLCPPCTAAYEAVGSWGPSTVERAYLAHLEAAGRTRKAKNLRTALAGDDPPSLPPWVALGTGPSTRPWQHLGQERTRRP